MSITHEAVIEDIPDVVFPTAADIKNGWTPKTLRAYLIERRSQQIEYSARKKPSRVVVQNYRSFDPHTW